MKGKKENPNKQTKPTTAGSKQRLNIPGET